MKKLLSILVLGCSMLSLMGCSVSFNAGTSATNENTNVAAQTNINTAPVAKKLVAPAAGLLRYRGSWFDVWHPGDFEASPALEAEDKVETDEARFSSPDGAVEFFIYSPRWIGETTYTAVLPSEVKVDESSETTSTGHEKTDRRYVTVKAKDDSYTRSFVVNTVGTDYGSEALHVFGIKYRDQASYDKYKAAYETFKASLEQYTDGYVEQ